MVPLTPWMRIPQDGPDPRTQYDLLTDIRAAERDRSPAAVHAVRDAWQGRVLSWEALVVPALCDTATTCHVVPFDHARIEGIVRQGWLPRLQVVQDDVERLAELCATHAPCVVTFEGRLDAFRFSLERPTELGFSDISFVTARAPRAGESWGRRFVPGRGDLDALRQRADALRAKGYTPTLHRPEEG